MLQPIFSTHLTEVIYLLEQHKVKRAYAFGSVCTENFNNKSDIDILIDFEDGSDPLVYGESYWILSEKLEEIFHRPVDLIIEKSLRNPYFIKVINKTKTLFYER